MDRANEKLLVKIAKLADTRDAIRDSQQALIKASYTQYTRYGYPNAQAMELAIITAGMEGVKDEQ